MTTLSNESLVELGRARGLDLDAARAEQLRPALVSLLDRLRALAAALPPESTPPAPGGVAPLPRSGPRRPAGP